MLTLSRRGLEIEASAEQMRQVRRRTAQTLRQARNDDRQDHEAACWVLEAYNAAGELPNPDRRSSCERYAERAWMTYHNLCAVLDLNSRNTAALIVQTEEAALLYTALAETAPH